VLPLAKMDLSSPDGRAVAVDQSLVQITHIRCDSRRGDGRGQRVVSRVPCSWRAVRTVVASLCAEEQQTLGNR
jgi:hypothetical protein